MPTALIIDDEKDIRDVIELAFSSIGVNCHTVGCIKDAVNRLKKQQPDFCITDMRLPDGDGLDLVAYVQKKYPEMPICVITAHGNMELAVKALKLGAFDFVNKPFDLKQLREMAEAAIKLLKNSEANAAPQNTTNKPSTCEAYRIIGESEAVQHLNGLIKKLARSQAPVFIHGESGTGKELVARNIHHLSARHEAPFIAINCGAIPENLMESEFFGYKKGAFTGANQDQPGLFVSANNGTLFLDEVADLPLNMQVKLLRAIQEKAVRPVGGDREISVNVRVLSATHKDLEKLVEERSFREDLYYRLNVITLNIPPLRERGNDILLIAEHIIQKLSASHEIVNLKLSRYAQSKLRKYAFPGNIRELENVLERAVTFAEESTLSESDIQFAEGRSNNLLARLLANSEIHEQVKEYQSIAPTEHDDHDVEVIQKPADQLPPNNDNFSSQDIDNAEQISDLDGYLAQVEKRAILDTLKVTAGNKTKAAEKLGLSFRAMRYKLHKYDIK